jgi:hypothetical protein
MKTRYLFVSRSNGNGMEMKRDILEHFWSSPFEQICNDTYWNTFFSSFRVLFE